MSIFNLVVERKKKTGPITPKYEGICPPMPSCEPPKKELPEPPFNATTARSYAHWKEEEAINTIKNKTWEDIKKEVQKGGVVFSSYFDLYPRFTYGEVSDVERACILLSSKLYKIFVDFGVELVKMGYTVIVTNDVYSDKYYDTVNHKMGFSYNTNSLDKVKIEIRWGDSEDTQEPYLKTIDHSGHLVRELDENNSEHFIRPERVFVKTKGELENGDKSDE